MTPASWKIAAFVALAALIPIVAPPYLSFQLTQTIGLALALLGLNVLVGWAGQICLGQGAFFAIGAYAVAMLMNRGMPWWLALPVGTLGAAVLGYLLGKPALRLERAYLALATFALALAVPQLIRYRHWEVHTGGAQGLPVTRPEPPSWLDVSPDTWMYWIALTVATLMFVATHRLRGGPQGLACQALRDHPVAAAACGVDVAGVKTRAFVLSAACAGAGGGLYALNVQLVTPDSFTLFLSLTLLIGVVVGGLGSSIGPLLGALFIQFVPGIADKVSTSASWAVFGAAVLLVVFFAPRGLAGLPQQLKSGRAR